MKSAVPGSTNDVDFLDGMQWGLSFLINPERLANRPLRRLPGLGRPRQFLLLDRSGKAGGRRLRDTTAAILRRRGGLAVRRVRERGV